MPTYRIFTVGCDQHFSGMPEIVECVDDNEAVIKGCNLRTVSIWRFGTISEELRVFRVARQRYRHPQLAASFFSLCRPSSIGSRARVRSGLAWREHGIL